MKITYISDDGVSFTDEAACRAHETRLGLIKTGYAQEIAGWKHSKLCAEALKYSKWLRDKQNYPATDSGEHHVCDLMNELVARFGV